jgi:perosamine synthetase
VPSFSFISTANCVVLAGAKPIFADIEKSTLGLEPNSVSEKITPKTKAILPMHYGGRVCKNLNVLKEIANDYNLLLIEDNAESFGAKIDNKYAGTIGDAGMLSFCQNKIISTGEGGAICTDDEKIYKKLLLIRSHGRVERPGVDYFSNPDEMEYIEVGYNYRMPTLNAALGISQIHKVDKIIEMRQEKAKRYNEKLSKISQVKPLDDQKNQRIVYQLYCILMKNIQDRKLLQEYLMENKIFTKVYFYPIHLKEFYRKKFGYNEGTLPNTEEISKKILTLPMSPNLTIKDQEYVTSKIGNFFHSS